MATLMGRAATHTGKTVTWDQMMNSKFQFVKNIDGLTFDQFALEAGSKDYGVTSGGTGEVIVGSVPISDVTILNYAR